MRKRESRSLHITVLSHLSLSTHPFFSSPDERQVDAQPPVLARAFQAHEDAVRDGRPGGALGATVDAGLTRGKKRKKIRGGRGRVGCKRCRRASERAIWRESKGHRLPSHVASAASMPGLPARPIARPPGMRPCVVGEWERGEGAAWSRRREEGGEESGCGALALSHLSFLSPCSTRPPGSPAGCARLRG